MSAKRHYIIDINGAGYQGRLITLEDMGSRTPLIPILMFVHACRLLHGSACT